MFEFWLADENIIFAAAFVFMLLLGILQTIGLSDFGPDFGTDLDGDVDLDSPADGMLAFLGVGRLPLMMLIVIFLALFSMVGFAGQQFYEALFGQLLTPWLAVPASVLVSLPLLGAIAVPLSRIIPQDETTAIHIEWLVGKRAKIQIGESRVGYAARAKIEDRHGHSHFIMVEPDSDGDSFAAGEEVLIVRKEGEIFKAISPEAYKQLALEQ
ncbi:MAG: YqiJ family protein [Parasphingorhabdus sp.]